MEQENLHDFRKLWLNFLNLKTTLKIQFIFNNLLTTNYDNFCMSNNFTTKICNSCNQNMILLLYFDSNNNLFFNFDFEYNNYLLLFCNNCKLCSIITNNNIDEILLNKNNNFLIINKIESLIDYESDKYNVPIIDDKSCCGEYNLKMSTIELQNNKTISKIGGNIESINRKKYKIIDYLKCKCYNSTDTDLILSLKAKDCKILEDLNIFLLEVTKCSTCNHLHFNIFSHELNMDYKMILFQNNDEFYHIIESEDQMNGVVLITSFNLNEIFMCCQLLNYKNKFEFTKSKKLSSDIKNILKLQLWDENTSKITQFLKKIKENNINIELISDLNISNLYGNGFYITTSLDEFEYLVELKDDELYFHGYFINNELLKLTLKQKEIIINIGAKIV
jgi:hypothetical protein